MSNDGGDVNDVQRSHFRISVQPVTLERITCLPCGVTLWQLPGERGQDWRARKAAFEQAHPHVEMQEGWNATPATY